LTSFLDFVHSIINSFANFAPEISPAIVGGSNCISRSHGILDQFRKLLSQELKQELFNKFVVGFQPFLGLNQSIVTQFLQDFQCGRTNLSGQFLSIRNDNLSLGRNFRHHISQDDLNLSFDRSQDGIHFILNFVEFLRDFVSQIGASFLDFVNGIFNGIANLFPEISEAVVLGSNNILDDLRQSLSEELEQEFFHQLVILFQPLFGLQQGIVTKVSEGFQSGFTHLNSPLLDILQELLGFSHEFRHNFSQDHIYLGFNGSHNVVDFTSNLGKLRLDSVSKTTASNLHRVHGIFDGRSDIVPKISPAIVRSNGIFVSHAILDHFGKLLSKELEQHFLHHLMVLFQPFLGFDQSIMSEFLQDLQGGQTHLLGQLFGILEDDFGFFGQNWHHFLHHHFDFGLDRGDDLIDLSLQLIKLFGDLVSQLLASGFDFVDGLVNGIANLLPEVGPAIRSDHFSLGASPQVLQLLEDVSTEPCLGFLLKLLNDGVLVFLEVFDAQADCLLTKVFEEGHHQVSDEFELFFAKVDNRGQLLDQRWVDIVQKDGGGVFGGNEGFLGLFDDFFAFAAKLIPQILAGDFGLLNHVGNRVLDLLQVVVPSVNVNIMRKVSDNELFFWFQESGSGAASSNGANGHQQNRQKTHFYTGFLL